MAIAELRASRRRSFMPSSHEHHEPRIYWGPRLEYDATFEFIQKIPKDEWNMPAPYLSASTEHYIGHIWKAAKRGSSYFEEILQERWQQRADEILTPWVRFVDEATRHNDFRKSLKRQIREGGGLKFKVGDVLLGDMYNEYRFLTSKRVGNSLGEIDKHLKSLRRGFAALLGKEARKKLGIKRKPTVKPDDIANVRHFVHMMNERRGKSYAGGFRAIEPTP